jgi:TonB family protein
MMARWLLFLVGLGISVSLLGKETQDPAAQQYGREVAAKIGRLISIAPQQQGKGSAQVRVQVNADGSIKNITIATSTGSGEIAEALRQAILKAQPLAPPPATACSR